MIRKLHFLTAAAAVTLICGSALAQSSENAVPFKTPAQPHPVSTVQNSRSVTCGPDSILYPYLKEVVFAAPNDSFFIDAMVGSVRTASQAYHVNSNIDILGVQFWGGAYTTSTVPQLMPVKAYLYSVDAQNMPVAILDSAVVSVTETFDFYEAMFAAPHTYGQNFAVAVRSELNDTLAVVTNNAGNVWTTNYGESLAWRRFGSGTWNSSVSFFGQDLEYMIFPIVQYNVAANFSMPNDSVCMNDTAAFTNLSSSLYSNRFLNLRAFDQYWGFAPADSSFSWNYGDNTTWTSSFNGSNVYTTSGNYQVSLAAEMLGYYTTCDDTMSLSLEVMPTVIAGFTYDNTAEPTIAFMDASTGATSYAWDFGDATTSGASNPSHTYTATGTYTVTLITNGFCGADTTSQTITITTTGIGEQSMATAAFYDNAAGELNVQLPAAGATIEVFSVSGDRVYAESGVNTMNKKIALGLAAGAYFVRVQTASGVSTAKFAVTK